MLDERNRSNMRYFFILAVISSFAALAAEARIGELLAELEKLQLNNPCACIDQDCGCCETVDLAALSLNNSLCVNATYFKQDMGFSFTLTYGSWSIINQTISVRNPPPICSSVSQLWPFEFCVRFYDVQPTSPFQVCIEVDVRLIRHTLAKIDFGCLRRKGEGTIRGKLKQIVTQFHNVINSMEKQPSVTMV